METLKQRVERQFLRGLGVKSVEQAIKKGKRTFEQWRDFLDVKEKKLYNPSVEVNTLISHGGQHE